MRGSESKVGKHFVLVHGACHGAWCWYKLSTSLRSSGHNVTAVDLGASGIDARNVDDIGSLMEYEQPLVDVMNSLDDGEKVVLVGHSYGGLGLALMMDMFPLKIEVAVFVTAFLPNINTPPSFTMQTYFDRYSNMMMDTEFTLRNGFGDKMIFGPKCLASCLYQTSPKEDCTLAMSLIRKAKIFLEELATLPPFAQETFGQVKKVYIVCKDDLILSEDFQRWMIENSTVDDVMEIDGADHMVMFSKPLQLHNCLMEIVKE